MTRAQITYRIDVAVGATCQNGCMIVAEKYFNKTATLEQLVDIACTMACLYFGIEEFVKVLEE